MFYVRAYRNASHRDYEYDTIALAYDSAFACEVNGQQSDILDSDGKVLSHAEVDRLLTLEGIEP